PRTLAPQSTLFPYTTLFRSASAAGVADALRFAGYTVQSLTIDRAGCWTDAAGTVIGFDAAVRVLRSCAVAVPMLHGAHGEDGTLDRKSTRLNSSHVKISYAV